MSGLASDTCSESSAGVAPARRGPLLLVSVRDEAEADAAAAGGADWIDLKEPAGGALGAVSRATAAAVTARIADQRRCSAAAGELGDWAAGSSRELARVAGLELLKLGLAGCRETRWRTRWRAAHEEIQAAGKSLAAVIYADAELARSPAAAEVLDWTATTGARWCLWDTFEKRGGSLLVHVARDELRRQLRTARELGLKTVVAGSLRREMISSLPLEWIDMIAVRGAACEGGRTGTVCAERVADLKQVVLASST